VDHHNHKLDQGTSGQGAGYTFSHIPRIPRATPPIPPPSQHRSRLGLDTAGTQLANSAPYGHITTTMDIHQTQRGQPSTVSSANSRSLRAANAATLLDLEPPNYYNQVDVSFITSNFITRCFWETVHKKVLTSPEVSYLNFKIQEPHNSLCSKCHGIILTPPPDEFPEVPLPPLKADGTWNFNYPLHHPALHRNNSIG